MSLRSASARSYATPAVGLVAALLLTGCGSGQRAQTYQEKAVAEATNDAVGSIAVRNLAVAGPPVGITWREGQDAPLVVTLVNEGGQDDTLVSVSTPAAASVEVQGPTDQLELPRLTAADRAYRLLLQDLTRDLQTGEYVEMTLTFERNGSKTMLVPVQTTPEGAPRDEDHHYEVAETDSAGKPIVEEEEDPQSSNVPDTEAPTEGDNGDQSPTRR